MALTQTEVSQLYVSLFGRASEGDGNTYWQANAPDMVSSADAMLNTDAAKEYFGDTINDNQKFIEFIYLNTLGKTYAEDKEGIDYWVAQLEAGKSQGTVSVELITAAQDPANAGDAQDQFNNKVGVSNDAADKIPAFTTIAAFTSYIADVDNTAESVTAATALVDADVVAVPGETFALTTAADLITGTANDDTITGYVGTNSAMGNLMDTFQSVDVIDGGAGNDTLSVSSDTANANIGATINNVEDIVFTTYKSGALTTGNSNFNMSNVSGLETLTNKNSIARFVTENSTAMNVGVTNVNANTTDINFTAGSYVSADDSTTLTLNNASNSAKIGLSGAGGGVETLNVVTTGAASKVDLGGSLLDGTSKMVITGDQDFSFDDAADLDGSGAVAGTELMSSLKTVDASALTGKLDADLANGGAVDLTITGTAQDDKVKIANFNKADVVDLGEGADTLNIVMNADVTTAAAITNVETLGVYGAGSYTMNLDAMDSIATINFGKGNDVNTLTNVQAVSNTVNFVNDQKTTSVVDSLSYTLEDGSGTADELNLNFTNTNALTGASEAMTKENTLTVSNLTAANVETVNIATSYLGANDAAVATNKGGLIVGTMVNLTEMQTLKVSSDTYVTLNGALDGSVKTINAADAAGGIFLNISAIADADVSGGATASLSVTTGAGADTLGVINGDVKQTINTGAGKDTLTFGETNTGVATTMDGKQTINMGAGNDTVTIDSATIVAGTTGSKLDFGADSDTLIVDLTAGVNLLTFAITNVETVVLSANGGNLKVNAAGFSGKTIDLSTFGTGVLELTGTTSGDTINAGGITANGAIGIVALGLAGNDTITGTANLDAITGGAGADVINGGAGIDTYTMGATDSNVTTATGTSISSVGIDTITTTVGDKFAIAGAVLNAGAVTTAIAVAMADDGAGAKATGADLITAVAAGITEAAGETFLITVTDADIDVGTGSSFSGTYVVNTLGVAFNAADMIIEVVGITTIGAAAGVVTVAS